MEPLKAQAAKIRQQVSGMTASQRMLAMALVVIMAMTLLWWGRFASTSDLVPLLGEQAISADDLARIPAELRGKGINVSVVNDRIQVPADRQIEAMAILGYNDLLPADTTRAYDQIITQQLGSPWESATVTRERLIAARAAAMRQVLRTMVDVRDAHVLLNAETRRGLGDTSSASAAVHITTKSGKGGKRIAQAARTLVAGGTGIAADKVNVTVDEVTFRDDSDLAAGMASSDQLEQTAAYERRFKDKIEEQLSHISGAKATVTVHLDARVTHQTSRRFDAANTLSKEGTTHTRREETVNYGGAGGEPGVLANVGASVTIAAAGGGSTSTTEDEEITNQVLPSFTDEQVSVPAGRLTTVSAGVQIPLSFYRREWKARNPAANADPDETQLQPIIDARRADIEAIVKACLGGDGVKPEVSVRTYVDLDDIRPVPTAEASFASATLSAAVTGHARQIAVGVLAVVSLAMVMTMARRSSPAAVVLPGEASSFGGEDDEDDVAAATLPSGMQPDDETLRSQQVVEHVKNLVRKDPDSAAGQIQRWLKRT